MKCSLRFMGAEVLVGAVDQDGEVIDVFLQSRRDATATKCFLSIHAAVYNLFNLG